MPWFFTRLEEQLVLQLIVINVTTVVLNHIISPHLGDVQKSSLVKVDPKPEVFAAVKGTRLKCRVVPKKVN